MMDSAIHPADLDGCVRPLDEEDRRVVCRYWELVIRECWPRRLAGPGGGCA